jgi:hypothetical protein
MWTRVGPAVQIEWGLWVTFDNCVFVNSSMDASENDPIIRERQYGYSDRHAGILVTKLEGSAAILFISNCIFKNGNLKYYAGGGNFSFHIRNCIIESVFTLTGDIAFNPPPVHLIDPSPVDGAALIEYVGVGDVKTESVVKIEGQTEVAAENIVCINTAHVIGPATIINTPSPRIWQGQKKTLAGKKQVGFWQGRVAAQHDSARRTFNPVAVRFKNLMPQDPQEITIRATGNATLTTNVLAPDGTQRAFNLSPNSNGLQSKLVVCRRIVVSQPVNVGDIIVNEGDIVIAGVWARAAATNGFLPAATSIVYAGFHDYRYRFEGTQESVLRMGAPLKGDGEWEWLSVAGKVSKHSGFDTDLEMAFFCLDDRANNRTYSHDLYAPILLYIPISEGISDNEMHELRQHLSTWPDNVEPGTVSLLRGQDFALQSHIVSKGTKPIVPIGAHDPRLIEIDGNDVSGRISVKAGSIISNGIIATLEFSKLFRSKPRVLLTAANHHASTIPIFVDSSEQKFSIHTTITSGQLEQDSVWNYFVIE